MIEEEGSGKLLKFSITKEMEERLEARRKALNDERVSSAHELIDEQQNAPDQTTSNDRDYLLSAHTTGDLGTILDGYRVAPTRYNKQYMCVVAERYLEERYKELISDRAALYSEVGMMFPKLEGYAKKNPELGVRSAECATQRDEYFRVAYGKGPDALIEIVARAVLDDLPEARRTREVIEDRLGLFEAYLEYFKQGE